MNLLQLQPERNYRVTAGANETFLMDALVKVGPDGVLWTSHAGELAGYRQPGWLEMRDMRPEFYEGVEFSAVNT